ncbi:MAG: GatB/YqeY domain-containing protein [Dehalococcoidia bacterium]|nr:GatB/YqeY domain-containing protein [Dehalococcoidia bacterium]
MTLQDKLTADMQQAMKSGDKVRLSVLRMVKAAIKNAEIEKMVARGSMDDAGVIDVLSRQAKQRRESVTEFKKANRQEMAASEEAELAIIMGYLPQQMSADEIVTIVRQVIEETGAQGPRDKGKVMSKLMPQLKGKADGQVINEMVSRLLGGP